MALLAFSLTACKTTDTPSLGSLMSAGQSILSSSILGGSNGALNNTQVSAGLREALIVGTGVVVSQLGQSGGFGNDANIRIPLPDQLQKIESGLGIIGASGLTDDLKSRMNTAAEMATPRAKDLFIKAIKDMTITDARAILNGPNDAATIYLRGSVGQDLATDIAPLVQNALQQAGAIQAYDAVLGQYASLPFVSDLKTNLNDYVVDKTLDGIFYYVAEEEAAIRTNPAKRTTELLQKVFGS